MTDKSVEDWAKDESATSENELKAIKAELRKAKDLLDKKDSAERTISKIVAEAYKGNEFKFPICNYKSTKKPEEVAVLHITDTQIGKRTATYNSEVAAKRLAILAEKTIRITELRRNVAKIDEAVLFIGGDIVEGEEIFKGQGFEIDSPLLTQACKTAPEILTNVALKLLETFNKVKIYCVRGNHGRVSSPNSYKYTNFDLVAYYVMKHMLEAAALKAGIDIKNRLEFNIADDKFWVYTEICGWGNILIHGDEISGSGGFAQFPLASVVRKLFGWAESIKEPFDFIWMGHRHTHLLFSVNNKTILSTGSPESDNEYAQEVLAVTGYPSQRLAFFNKEYGLISDNQIFLSEPGERVPAKYRWK